jgi:hypothetical protein
MNPLDCAIGEELHFGSDIRIQLTGRVGDVLYVFIEAGRAHALVRHAGFSATATYRRGYRAHVLALRDQDRFAVGPVRILVDRVRGVQPGARLLRDVCLQIEAPMACVRGVGDPIRRRLSRAG